MLGQGAARPPYPPRQRTASSGLRYATKACYLSFLLAHEAWGNEHRIHGHNKHTKKAVEKVNFLSRFFTRFPGCFASSWRRLPPCPWVTTVLGVSPARCLKMQIVCPEEGSRGNAPCGAEGRSPPSFLRQLLKRSFTLSRKLLRLSYSLPVEDSTNWRSRSFCFSESFRGTSTRMCSTRSPR